MIWPLDWMIYRIESGSAVKAHGSQTHPPSVGLIGGRNEIK